METRRYLMHAGVHVRKRSEGKKKKTKARKVYFLCVNWLLVRTSKDARRIHVGVKPDVVQPWMVLWYGPSIDYLYMYMPIDWCM